MDQKLLPAILMSILSLGSLAIILRGLKFALLKTGWEEDKQRKIFTTTIIGILLWVALISLVAIKGFFFSLARRGMEKFRTVRAITDSSTEGWSAALNPWLTNNAR